MEIKRITVESSGERADVYLSTALDYTRSRVKKILDDGLANVDGKPLKPRDILKQGSVVTVEIKEPTNLEVKAVDIPLDIVYEDSDLAVINKEQGLTVHAGSGTNENTLVNALLYKLDSLSGINGVIRPGIVHRIDKDTSGLLVVAKNDKAHLSLASQIQNKTCSRVYVALLEGNLKSDSGVIDTFIDRSTKNRTMMAVSNSGRNAVTEYKVLKRFDGYTLCEFRLKTGRTHQIRVHAKHLGHPVVGDLVYGFKANKFNLKGQLLHAKELSFIHPTTNERVTFTAPIPAHFENVLKKLKEI